MQGPCQDSISGGLDKSTHAHDPILHHNVTPMTKSYSVVAIIWLLEPKVQLWKRKQEGTQPVLLLIKGQENPEFCASGTYGSFPYNSVVGSGTYGNNPVGPEILFLYAKGGLRKLALQPKFRRNTIDARKMELHKHALFPVIIYVRI